jgi:hypothetical protein
MAAPATAPESTTARPKERGVPITFHMPDEVRDQLKMLAVKRKTTMHDLGAEAFNDLFAKHGLPEIAPVTRRS